MIQEYLMLAQKGSKGKLYIKKKYCSESLKSLVHLKKNSLMLAIIVVNIITYHQSARNEIKLLS